MAYGNYGNKGGFKRPQPKPRPVLDQEHDDAPLVRLAVDSVQEIRPFGTEKESSRDTVIFDNDTARTRLPLPVAAILAMRACGIPHDHPDFPAIAKIRTDRDTVHYSLIWNGPVPWLQDENWRHIPGFTRYVISPYGIVRNAYNGMIIEEQWGNVRIAPDGVKNVLINKRPDELVARAYKPMPAGFTVYGEGRESHAQLASNLGIHIDTDVPGWYKLSKVKVKHPDGMTSEYDNLNHFMINMPFVQNGKFYPELREHMVSGIPALTKVWNVDGFAIMPTETFQLHGGPVPVPEVKAVSNAVAVSKPESNGPATDTGFVDDDFQF